MRSTLKLGDALHQLRRSRERTQASVAARVGVDRSTLAKWESGENLPSASLVGLVLDELIASPGERRSVWATYGVPEADLALESA